MLTYENAFINLSYYQAEHDKWGCLASELMGVSLPKTIVVQLCRACVQIQNGIITSFGCHSEYIDLQKVFLALLLCSLGNMFYGCALPGAVCTAGTADFTFLGFCQVWHLLAVFQAPHLTVK